MVNGCTSKTLDDQRLAIDLSSDLALTSGAGILAGYIRILPIGFWTITMNGCSHREAPCLECLNSDQTTSAACTYNLLLKMLKKWLVPCTAPVLVLSSTFTKARSGLKWGTVAIYEQELSSLHFQVLIKSRLFFTLQPLSSITSLSLFNCYFHRKCSDKLHSLVPTVLTFSAKTCHALHIVANNPHSFHIPFVRCKFHSFFPRTAALWNQQEGVFQSLHSWP